MNKKQLSERIGNMDDRLVQEAERIPNYQRAHRKKGLRWLAACAAMLLLMAGSFRMGMVVYAQQETVEMPPSVEIYEMKEIGLSVIVPDSWIGRYGVEKTSEDCYTFYSTEVRAACMAEAERELGINLESGGNLFYIVRWPEQLTKEQVDAGGEWDYVANEYIMTTKDGTYLFYHVSDVEYTEESKDLYDEMMARLRQVRFVTDSVIGANASVQ